MSKGIFGSLFDFNGNGQMEPLETAAEYMFLNELAQNDADDCDTMPEFDLPDI